MTDTCRQKLLNLLSNIAILLLFWWLSITVFWLFGRSNPNLVNDLVPFEQAAFLADSFRLYAIWSVPIMIWHSANMLQLSEPSSRVARIADNFVIFLSVSTAGMAAHSLAASAILTQRQCPKSVHDNEFGFVTCLYGPPDWLRQIVISSLLSVCLLCMAKVAISIRSRLRRTM